MMEPRPEIKQVIRIADRAEPREKLVCLDKNERADPFPPSVLEGLLGCLRSQDLTGYPVLEPFYEELAAWLRVPRSWLVLTGGADPAIRSTFEVYARPRDPVISLKPTFAMYPIYAQLFGTQLRELTYDTDLFLASETVVDALQPGVRLLLLPNPNSPTGTAFSVPDLERILGAARQSGTLVLVDEAYYYFTEVTAFDLVPRYENLVVVRTFSKAAGLAGVRLGYMLTQPQNADFLRRVKPMYEINGLALRLGQYLIRNDHLLYEYAKQANEGRKYLQREFSRLGGRPFESHANFVVCRLPPGSNIPGLVSALRDRGYLIKGGFSEPPLADCIRVSTASPATLEGFVRVFELIYKEFVPTA